MIGDRSEELVRENRDCHHPNDDRESIALIFRDTILPSHQGFTMSQSILLESPIPDLAIEVVFSSGSPNKLLRYQVLQIPEVWFWEDGVFRLYRYRGSAYEPINSSEITELIDLDINLLTRCILMAQTSRLEAVTEFRKGIKIHRSI